VTAEDHVSHIQEDHFDPECLHCEHEKRALILAAWSDAEIRRPRNDPHA